MTLMKKRIVFFLIVSVCIFSTTDWFASSLLKKNTSEDSNSLNTVVITLITGDEVSVYSHKDSTYDISVLPAIRGNGIQPFFTVFRHPNRRTLVIPSDISHLVPTVIDEKFFNIDYLIEKKLDDRNTPSIPVIVKLKQGRSVAAFMKRKGMESGAPLHLLNGVAVSFDKKDLKEIQNPAFDLNKKGEELSLKEIEKIYLDAKVKISMDQALPIVGGDSVLNQTGLDGSGVNIAILDTGIDERHPDFLFLDGTSKIRYRENFTCISSTDPEICDDSADDLNGHGTHVAGIAAGTGAFSNGKYRGMAPLANLLNIKVIGKYGLGMYSSVIKGLDAAVFGTNEIRGDEPEKEADIISISFGSLTDGEEDPVADLITSISERYGVLTVASAGNDGALGSFSIHSPGTAEGAVTVGMSTKEEPLSVEQSSGMGPVDMRNFMAKPDIVAPGDNIIAPCSVNDPEGCSADFPYLAYSGSSMATPIVAGSAALLIQKRRTDNERYSPLSIKSDLLSTAKKLTFLPERENIYVQGAGLLNIQHAAFSTLRFIPSKLDIGAVSSHMETLNQEVTLKNTGNSVRHLSAAWMLQGSKVEPHSKGGGRYDKWLTVEPQNFSLEPGEIRKISLTFDLSSLPCSIWSVFDGEILIKEKDAPVGRMPFGFTRKKPMIPVEISAFLPDGTAAPNVAISIFDAKDPHGFHKFRFVYQQPFELEVPEGVYNVVAYLMNRLSDPDTLYRISSFDIDIKGERKILKIESSASLPVSLSFPEDPDVMVRRHVTSMVYSFKDHKKKSVEMSCGIYSKNWGSFSVSASSSPVSGSVNVYNHWLLSYDPSENSSVMYDIIDTRKKEEGFEKIMGGKEKKDLAHVVHRMHGDMDVTGKVNRFSCPADTEDFPTCLVIFQNDLKHPSRIVQDEYFTPDKGRYAKMVWPQENDYSFFYSYDSLINGYGISANKIFSRGEKYDEEWIKRPVVFGLNSMVRVKGESFDFLVFNEKPFLFDASGHPGYHTGSYEQRISINDEIVSPFSYSEGYNAVRIPKDENAKVDLYLSAKTIAAWSHPISENTRKLNFWVDGGIREKEISIPVLTYESGTTSIQNRVSGHVPLSFRVKMKSSTSEKIFFKKASIYLKDSRVPFNTNKEEENWIMVNDIDVEENVIEVETDSVYQTGNTPFVSIRLIAETTGGMFIDDVIDNAFVFETE